jgi:hypothetical protein
MQNFCRPQTAPSTPKRQNAMRTLSLIESRVLSKMHAEEVRRRAKAGCFPVPRLGSVGYSSTMILPSICVRFMLHPGKRCE